MNRLGLSIRFVMAWFVVSGTVLSAQDAPARARLIGPQALTGGVLRCEVNDRMQLVFEATSSKLKNVELAQFRPNVSSSDEDVVQAVVEDDARSSYVLCSADGRAEITYKIGNLTLCVPVLVGTARKEDSNPCASGFTTVATASGARPKVELPDKPVKGRFQTPEWLTHDGVMSCERGNDWQLILDVTTDKLQPADLTYYPPRVKTSNESVVSAVVNEDPRSVQINCASNGRAELTLQVADLVFCIPVVVSDDAAARDATPCAPTATAAPAPPRGRPARDPATNKIKTVQPCKEATATMTITDPAVRIGTVAGAPAMTIAGTDSVPIKFYRMIADAQFAFQPISAPRPDGTAVFHKVQLRLRDQTGYQFMPFVGSSVGIMPITAVWTTSDAACVGLAAGSNGPFSASVESNSADVYANVSGSCNSVTITVMIKQPVNSSGLPGCALPLTRNFTTVFKTRP